MDRKQTRDFDGFVAVSGDVLLRMATLLTSDVNLAEDVNQETLHRLAAVGPGREPDGVLPRVTSR